MVDHGADAAAVIANAATDITKGMMQISAAGLKQLFLLLYEGKELQVGETNIERLVKMLDEGDSIKDIIVQKEYTEKFVELSRKHGVTYAVAEMPDGKMVVYYPESQDNRVENIMKDILGDMNHTFQESESMEKDSVGVEVSDYINEALYEDSSDRSKTVVFFDAEHPNYYTSFSKDSKVNGEAEITCYIKSDEKINEHAAVEEGIEETNQYGKRMFLEVDGLYKEKQIEAHIQKICEDIKNKALQTETLQYKEKLVDDILSKNSALDGSLHTITDSGNKNNVIVIYKQLEQAQDGQIKTANKVMVYEDGKLTEKITPKEAIAGYEKYKAAEKQGKSAERQYQKILSGEYFKGKEINKEVFAVQNTLSIKENDGEKTVVLFDGKNPNHYVKISQERQENGSYEIKKMIRQEDGQMKAVSYEAAAQEGYTYEQRMHFEVDGLYTEKEIEEHIGKVCTDIKKQDMTKEAIRDKENVIDNLLAKTAALNGSIHTVTDAGNRNNMVVIYKQLEPTPDGEFKTVNKAMVFYNGEIVQDISPKQAVLSYEKYKIMEKQGKSAEKHLEKILAGELFKDRDSDKDMESGRRPLSSYEKEIEKIKELEPKKAEIKEMVVESPIKAVKEPAELGR